MFAVVEIGGRQYKVKQNDQIEVEKLNAEVGGSLTFNKVLLTGNDDVGEAKIGQPYLHGSSVEAKVMKHFKGEKIRVFKFIAKKRHKKTHGHRQNYTMLEVTKINIK